METFVEAKIGWYPEKRDDVIIQRDGHTFVVRYSLAFGYWVIGNYARLGLVTA